MAIPRFPVFSAIRCIVCRRHVRDAHKRCLSCGNSYHNQCYAKAPVCSHPILQYVSRLMCCLLELDETWNLRVRLATSRHIKHLGPDRFNSDRAINQARSHEQSRSLPRHLLPVSGPTLSRTPHHGLYFLSRDPIFTSIKEQVGIDGGLHHERRSFLPLLFSLSILHSRPSLQM